MKILWNLVFFVLGLTLVHGQASLEIFVLDAGGKPLDGQLIRIDNEEIGFSRQIYSGARGTTRLTGLSTAGSYTVFLEESLLFQAVPVQNILLSSGKTSSVVLVLEDKTTELEGITVLGSPYLSINATDAEVASFLDAKELGKIPLEGRDVSRALYRLPNISLATGFFPEAPVAAINGANSLYTSYQIDGMDNNENFLGGQRFAIPKGFAKSITALTNNFSAEHGQTANGIINITTQSGTNQVYREFFFVTRPGPAIDGTPEFAQRDLSGNQVKNGFQRYQGGFALGGPLKKDKTFYFLNVEHSTDLKDNALTSAVLGVNETLRGTNQFTYFSGKLDHHWSDRWLSSLRLNRGLVNIERQGGGLDGGVVFPSAGNRQDRNSLNLALKNTYRGDRLVFESNYLLGKFHWDYARPKNAESPNVTVEAPDGQIAAVLGHPGFIFDETEETFQIQQKISFYSGNHTFKAGAAFKSSAFSLFGGGNPNGSYVVRLDDSQLANLREIGKGAALVPQDIPSDAEVLFYGVELRPTAFGNTQNIVSMYAEDQWNLHPSWNLNLGLRYDYDNLSKGGGKKGDLNNFAPRLGLNYRLNTGTTLRAGYGIYYDKILYAVYSDALQFNSTSTDYAKQLKGLIELGLLPTDTDIGAVSHEGNLVATVPVNTYLEGPPAENLQDQRSSIFQNELRILNPEGYQNPYSHQWMLGIQKKISKESMFYVDLLHNRSYNLFRLRNLNAPAPWKINPEEVKIRSQAAADASRPIPIYADAQGFYALYDGIVLRGGARNVVMTETEGRSNYYALNFTWQKERGEGSFAWRMVYTLSWLDNNTEDINFRAMDSNDFDAEWGPSVNDRRHLINGLFYWYPHKKLSINLTALIQSGQPVNRIPDATVYGTTDLNGDGRSFGDAYVGNSDREPGEARNSDRLPWAVTLDNSIFYTIQSGNRGKLELGIQVFNLLDAENWSGYANAATQSNQIQAGTAASGIFVRRNVSPPRQFQFSVRYLINQ